MFARWGVGNFARPVRIVVAHAISPVECPDLSFLCRYEGSLPTRPDAFAFGDAECAAEKCMLQKKCIDAALVLIKCNHLPA